MTSEFSLIESLVEDKYPNHKNAVDNLNRSALALKQENEELAASVRWFKEQIALANEKQFNRTADGFKQPDLFDAAGVQMPDQPIDPEIEEPETQIIAAHERKSRKPKTKGRLFNTEGIEKEVITCDLTEAEKICACGECMKEFDRSISHKLDVIPESYKLLEYVQPKYACPKCEQVKAQPKPECGIAKCMATSNFIADIAVKKYEHHLPLYRQSKILHKNGIEIPDNTLGNWIMKAAEVLQPLGEAAWAEVPKVEVLQADETPVKILQPDKKGWMWAYHSCDPGNRFVMFEFNLSRAAKVVDARLEGFSGKLQTDGYSGYNTMRANPNMTNFGCWDHARRKFTDAIKANGDNAKGLSGRLLKLINKLYRIEREAKCKNADELRALRQQNAQPILDQIYLEAKKSQWDLLPKSKAGEALRYLNTQRALLTRYVNHGDVQISNCWVENLIRPFALGRKNWLFVGTEKSANKAALLYSLIHSCRMNHIDPKRYLAYVIDQTHKMRRGEVNPATLLPQRIDKKLLE